MENAGYIFAAFAVVWVFVFGYVFSLVRRQANIKKQIDSLRETTGEVPGGQSSAPA